eukprot:TRINITY_DN65476_c0_g1_i1.p1 TRINITY_DN65476_c0_g1~~TRINITY_DN65476_c0_g1_i1.p1  ORF type:complete len:265 (+),score=42.80 TRINITY_DN65476_c0_g1_i1:77-871(+)
MGHMLSSCSACWGGLLASRRKKEKPPEENLRWVFHGGIPMLTEDRFEGGLPGYVGMVTREQMQFASVSLEIETWPDYRIGAMHWPSGRLLARALAEASDVLPPIAGRSVVELGAGPGLPGLVCAKLGASSVVLTDLIELVPLMDRNIELNSMEAVVRSETLDWLKASESPLAAKNRAANAPPLDLLVAADVVYVEEQEPLMGAMLALMEPGHTELVLAYKNRNPGDREYLNSRILARLENVRFSEYCTPEDGRTELYVGRLRKT